MARRANVTRKTVHKHADLMAVIDQYRNHSPGIDQASTSATTGRGGSIVAALRRKIATQASEINELKTAVAQHQATIELLYGQLEDRHYGALDGVRQRC